MNDHTLHSIYATSLKLMLWPEMLTRDIGPTSSSYIAMHFHFIRSMQYAS